MRITMGMISRQYSSSLNSSLNDLNRAYQRATDYRAFNKTSEDPFAASKAYRLRRESSENTTYQDLVKDTVDQFTTAESSMQSIYTNVVKEAGSGDCLQAINGTVSKSDRKIIATKLRQLQDEIISPLNTKYGDKYLFGGSDMTSPPFTMQLAPDGVTKQLYYRGVNVDNGELLNGETTSINGALVQFGKDSSGNNLNASLDGKKIVVKTGSSFSVDDTAVAGQVTITVVNPNAPTGTMTNQQLLDALKTQASATGTSGTVYNFSSTTMTGDMNRPVADGMTSDYNVKKQLSSTEMDGLAKESSSIDIGMGLDYKGTALNEQSVFNAAIPGISFLGYGTKDGSPNDIYTLLGNIADQLDATTTDAHSEKLSDNEVATIGKTVNKFNDQGKVLLANITEVGTKSTFLTTTKSGLETMGDAITDKDDRVEFVDPADAISAWYMQNYAYNAALSMGTKIISKTLLDFMG